MLALFNNETVRAIDRYAIEKLRLTELFLMEQAGKSVVQSVFSEYGGQFTSVLVVCGKGNNGGDGFVIADLLADSGIAVTVLHFPETQFSPAAEFYFKNMVRNGSVTVLPVSELFESGFADQFDLVIDALLGSGAKFPVAGQYAEIIKKLNESCAPKISVDIPTGVNGSTGDAEGAVQAELTISLAALKQGLFIEKGRAASGKVVSGSIGIQGDLPDEFVPSSFLCEHKDMSKMLPERPVDLHKYKAGKVMIMAGSAQYPGAAALSARGVLYSGAGAVYSALPESLYSYGNLHLPDEVIPLFYPDTVLPMLSVPHELTERAAWADAVCLGPGCGKETGTNFLLRAVFTAAENAVVVLDADALSLLAEGEYKQYNLSNSILTPHTGEFAKILGIPASELIKDVFGYGIRFAEETDAVLLYKSHRSVVFAKGSPPVVIPTGNNGLAKFGSGDVLAGIVTSFAAQLKLRKEAAIAASYLHGLSADILLQRHTEFGFTALDVARTIGEAIKAVKESYCD